MQPASTSLPPQKLPPQDGGLAGRLWALLGSVMFGAMLVALAIYTLPSLVSDWRIHDTARPMAGGRVTEGSCSSKLVVNICDATLSFQTKSGAVSRDVNYVFAGVQSGDYTVTVLADPAHPEWATTDMAIERLWNRTITLLVISGLLLSLTLAPAIALVRRLGNRGDAGTI